MLKPEELYNEQFELSVLGGYKREQVDSFFANVASDYEKLYKENAELIQKLKVCVTKIDEYQKDEQFLKTAIINAEKLNESSLRELEKREKEIEAIAKEKADAVVAQAQLEADNILNKARLEAAESIKNCEEDTAIKIAELKNLQEIEEEKLNNIKKEVSDFKEMVLKVYKKHLDSLSKLPEYEPKKPIKKEVESPAEDNTTTQESANTVESSSDDTSDSSALHEEAFATQTVNAVKPAVQPDFSQTAKTTEKTAEFVIDKPAAPAAPKEDDFERNFKFRDLKFGADFDIKNEK